MSVKQMALVWDLDLAPNKRLVLLAYADHADDDGGNVFPSLARVAHKTGYSRDQVRRISKELAADDLMAKVAEATHNRGAEYRLTLERGSKLPPLKPRRGVASDPPPVGADDPPPVGAPVPPEPSGEPPENHHVEANASSGIGQTPDSAEPEPEEEQEAVVGLEKFVTDRLYERMNREGFTLDNSDFGYHLGRAQTMLEKMAPTDDELSDLPDACVKHYVWKQWTDPMAGLRYLRQQKARAELKAVPDRGGDPGGDPGGAKMHEKNDKPMNPNWYESVYGVSAFDVKRWIEEGVGHTAIERMCNGPEAEGA